MIDFSKIDPKDCYMVNPIEGTHKDGWVDIDDYDYRSSTICPTVDVVEVVRCADCKFRDTVGCNMSFYDDTGEVITFAEDNDYCSKGERRTEDE